MNGVQVGEIEVIPGTKVRYILSPLPQPQFTVRPEEPRRTAAIHETTPPRIWRDQISKEIVDLETGYVYAGASEAASVRGVTPQLVRRHARGKYPGVQRFAYR